MKPIKVDGLNCFDNVVLTLCNYYFEDYCQAMWNAWQFSYKKSNTISEGISDDRLTIRENVLKYYGLDFKVLYEHYSEKVLRLFAEKIKQKEYVILGIDNFVCSWTSDYQVRHNPHVLIVTGICDGFVSCMDVMYEKYEVTVSLEDVRKGFLYLVEPVLKPVTSKNRQKRYHLSNMKKELQKHIKKNFREKEISKLLDSFKTVSWEKEFRNERNLWYITMYTSLCKIYSGHYHFSKFLTRCKEESGVSIDRKAMAVLEDLGDRWHTICLLVFRIHMSYVNQEGKESKYTEQIVNILEKIVALEGELKNVLLAELDEAEWTVFQERKQTYKYIELSYNEKSHLTGREHDDFIITDCFIGGREIVLPDCKFYVQNKNKQGYDVLVCRGQSIPVEMIADKCEFLGCAIWGDQRAVIEVVYKDGKTDEKEVYIADWNSEATEEQQIIWSGKFLSRTEGVDDCMAKVFRFGFHLGETTCIQKIVLPDNENVHIFAMTCTQLTE